MPDLLGVGPYRAESIMAHKKFGGWYFYNTLYLSLSISDKLWTVTRPDKDTLTKLFCIGWYSKEGVNRRVYNITILWLTIGFGTL